jgi:hypothetical protein
MMTVEMKPLPTELIDALLADYKKPEVSARVQYSSGVRAEGILREWSQS